MTFEDKAKVVIAQLRADRDRLAKALKDIRAEIDSHCSDNRDRNDGLYIAMKIIDKYRDPIGTEEG